MDYYQMLGVERDASDEAIRKAYKRAASKVHPDKEGGSHEAFLELKKAFDTLTDPILRQAYDLGCPGASLQLEVLEAQKEVATLFVTIANRVSSNGNFRGHINLIQEMKEFIESGMLAIGPQLRDPPAVAKALRKVHRRLKKNGGPKSFLHDALNEQRKNNWLHYRELQGNRRHLHLMLTLVESYEYEVDKTPVPGWGSSGLGGHVSGSSTYPAAGASGTRTGRTSGYGKF